ncbi:alpha/beta hydrolase [Burkholderia ubonensis]|uniref:Alpha/beta hydrolase n=1 Tax=Burkholderia ubonensis TaxID=101571 RepID=A0AB73FTY6_9BURK|nr:alpha/beta hydrolase [Burkholderia ubonensis]KVK74434.1 alpha/beta hydrolase [Burkholderia ubonensis]KVL75491.1 alpha/beta hydrolase [Burkholderia ubonensis]KVM21110.1 alpha/beta hydrolase [Burkholderia ubonensis]KVM29927.1 alpha/beta hydrolase [Burkholderia ubonensis]
MTSRYRPTIRNLMRSVANRTLGALLLPSICATAMTAAAAEPSSKPAQYDVAGIVAFRTKYFAGTSGFEQRREAFARMMDDVPAPAGVSHFDVDSDGVRGRWFTPTQDGKPCAKRIVLYIHGGGFYSGSSSTHRALVAQLAKTADANVFAVDYRLLPEATYPSQIDDVLRAWDWMIGKGYTPDRVVVAGESVGGNLAIELSLRLREQHRSLPAALFLMSPVTDLAATGESMVDNGNRDPIIQRASMVLVSHAYLGDVAPSNPDVSPLYANLRGLPPMLIQVGSTETLLDDAVRLARRAGNMGVPVSLEIWPNMIHQWQLFPLTIPDARNAIQDGATFVRAHTVTDNRSSSKCFSMEAK